MPVTGSPSALAAAPQKGRGQHRGGPSAAGAAAAVALSVVCSALLLWPQHGRALNWDEVDYVNAARKGVVTNLWERGSLSVPAYVRFAYDKIRHRPPHLPAGYDEGNDPFKLRHGHSPAVVAAMAPFAHTHSERVIRLVQLLGALALTVALVVAYRLVSPSWTWPGLVVILVVAPWYGWHMFRTVQFHGWATVWLCLAVAFLCRWLTGGRDRKWGLALCASLAALILTLESSAFVLLGVVVCLAIWVRGLGRRARTPWIRQYLLPGLLTVLAMTIVVWPGLVTKGGLLKLPAERYYQVFLGASDVYYFNSSADLLSYLLPAVVGVGVLAYLWRRHRDQALRWGPLVVIAAVYLASVLRLAVSETYFLPALAPLLVLLAWIAGELRLRVLTVVVTALVVAMLAGAASLVRTNADDRRTDRVLRADLAFVGDLVGGSRGLMDGGQIFRYYLPDHQIQDLSYNATGLLVRREGVYQPVPPAEYAGTVVGIQSTRTVFLKSPAAADLSARCRRIDRPTIVLWDCRGLSG
jgi:hypothetical protein